MYPELAASLYKMTECFNSVIDKTFIVITGIRKKHLLNMKDREGDLVDQVNQLRNKVKALTEEIEIKDKKLDEYKHLPDKHKLNRVVNEYINSETIDQMSKRILNDSVDLSDDFDTSDVYNLLDQIKSTSLFLNSIFTI